MDNIITPSESFDFSTIMLENPAPLHGGSFFTKLKFLDKGIPLYVQFPKCLSKNGFVKNNTSKRGYVDLQFNYFETDILTWMENLEEKCRQLIYEKRELWFQTEMLEEDIENNVIQKHEHKTPLFQRRLSAIQDMLEKGWAVRLCFDPILLYPDWEKDYQHMFQKIKDNINGDQLFDITVGVFRMGEDYFHRIKRKKHGSYSCR